MESDFEDDDDDVAPDSASPWAARGRVRTLVPCHPHS